MRMSRLFGQTLREAPAEAEVTSHRLLLRAGYIRQLAAGIFSYLPFGHRSMAKIENIMREEINAIGGQELTMPVVHPADLWKETGRWYKIGSEMGRFVEKAGRDMVLAMTHEEVVADLTRREVRSYRQLPSLPYHIQTKWRDDPRPRAGLIRAREFTMLDTYSLDADEDGLDRQYRAHHQAFANIFNRCALPTISVGADVGIMGGSLAHEFMYLTPIGEDTLVLCDSCGYSANRQVATFQKAVEGEDSPALPMEKVHTPGITTIEALANFLGVPQSHTAKAVFMVASIPEGQGLIERFVLAIVRGDMEMNETKLAGAVGASDLRPAREEEILAVGARPGYGSPIGVRGALVVIDDLVARTTNLVGGANEVEYHYLNTNYGRDYSADIVGDIVSAREGDPCPRCGASVRLTDAVEVGNIFKLGTHFSESLGALYLDRDGKQRPVVMGSYGIGVGRLLACVAEEHNDERGLVLPVTVAPFQVHLVSLAGPSTQAAESADLLYGLLQAQGVEVLYDDREESPGVKFADADLIGVPLRITIGERSLGRGGVEFKRRSSTELRIVPVEAAASEAEAEVRALTAEVIARVQPVPYTG